MHEVESMFSVKEKPWHGLGTILPSAPTVEEGIVQAGLNWNVNIKPLHYINDVGDQCVVKTANAIVRDSDDSVLGVVGKSYKPVQNLDAFKWFNPLIEEGDVSLESAGSLRNGSRVWVLAKIKNGETEIKSLVPNDVIERYVLLSNSHDGSLAIRVGFTEVRVVCNNTLQLSLSSSGSKLIRIYHRGKVLETLELVREVFDIAKNQFKASAEQYTALASRPISRVDLNNYVQVVFNVEEPTRTTSNVVENFLTDITNDHETWWGAYNAVTSYFSHEYARNNDNRHNSLWFGHGANMNKRALATAVELSTK